MDLLAGVGRRTWLVDGDVTKERRCIVWFIISQTEQATGWQMSITAVKNTRGITS